MSRRLKPCPFCGSENVAHKLDLRSGVYREGGQVDHYVECLDCRARGGWAMEKAATREGERAAMGVATKRWNRRATSEDES